MPEPYSAGGAGNDDAGQKDVKIKYKRYNKARISDSANFLPVIAVIAALLFALGVWFLWGGMLKSLSPAEPRNVPPAPFPIASAARSSAEGSPVGSSGVKLENVPARF
ncbi:MAG: hypothetical protein LBR87_08285 [Synergistaceae bacterium]|nr:hypothetical protein [Synergistaceae bacterium]